MSRDTRRHLTVATLTLQLSTLGAEVCRHRAFSTITIDFLIGSYTYIKRNQYPEGYRVSGDVEGCDCFVVVGEEGIEDVCGDSSCLCFERTCQLNQDVSPPRLLEFDQLVYECGDNCCCNLKKSACRCRITSDEGRRDAFELTKAEKGFAVRSTKPIFKGEFVIEYIGEVLDDEEASKRAPDNLLDTYLLTIFEHFGASKLGTRIDARYFGNESRFINHSCSPNLIVLPVRRDDPLRPKFCLFALRDIEVGEELSYDYGVSDSKLSNKKCLCAESNCLGFLPTHP